MKLKQIIEDEFGDLDDQDEFGPFILEIDHISYEKRQISYDTPFDKYINIVLCEFSYNNILISSVVSTCDDPIDRPVFGWWINDKPLDLMTQDEMVNILKKLELDEFVSEDRSSVYIFLLDILDDTAEHYNLGTTSYNLRHG